MKITYYGHACFLIEEDGFKGIIDPFITGNPVAPVAVEAISKVTHIFVTHGHSDHLGDAVALSKRDQAPIICNFDMAQTLQKRGATVWPMHLGGRTRFDFGKVKMTNAIHGSYIEGENGEVIYAGNPCGFLIECGGKRVYHAGDTGLIMDMQLLEAEAVDVAILPIGGNFTMDIEDAAKAVGFIKPKAVIPMHYKTFEAIEAEPEAFAEAVGEKAKTIVMPFGSSILVD